MFPIVGIGASAFHVVPQAMQHEFLLGAETGREMDLGDFFRRAAD